MKTRVLIVNIIMIAFIIAGLGYLGRHRIFNLWEQWMRDPEPEPVTIGQMFNQNKNSSVVNQNGNNNSNLNSAPVVIPDEFNLAIPFTTQSPDAKWTEQDEESCEEAAALIVHYYWLDKAFTKDIAEKELQTIVDFENEHYGKYKDTTAEETAQFIKDLWGYQRVDVKYDVTVEDIKREVAQGRPVIVPTAGRMLGNPNFKNPGPPYHMLVVRGWTKNMIITNDPGTRKGEGYQYKPEVLFNAIHDWTGSVDTITEGRKAMIVVWPNS
jgi:hypothetical protein